LPIKKLITKKCLPILRYSSNPVLKIEKTRSLQITFYPEFATQDVSKIRDFGSVKTRIYVLQKSATRANE